MATLGKAAGVAGAFVAGEAEVVETLHRVGLTRKVAEIRPLGVIKG